jgi:hypothetical protein
MSSIAGYALFALLGSLVATSSLARASDLVVIRIAGEARGSGKDARTQALDRAFARAVSQALDELASPELKSTRRTELDALVRRARRYVTSYQVLDERTVGAALQVHVAVTIDRELLRAAVAELTSASTTAAATTGKSGLPVAVLLLKYSSPDATVATFGSAAGNGGAGGIAFAAQVAELGFRTVVARGHPPVTREGGDDALPLSDTAAVAVAREVGAAVAFVAGVVAESDGKVRGTRLDGAQARAEVRVLDVRSGDVIARSSAQAAGFGARFARAAEAACLELARRSISVVSGAVIARFPAAPAPREQLVVDMQGMRSWNPVSLVIRRLAGTPGIHAVNPRIETDRVHIGIATSMTATQVTNSLQTVRLPTGQLSASGQSGRVTVVVTGDEPFTFSTEAAPAKGESAGPEVEEGE